MIRILSLVLLGILAGCGDKQAELNRAAQDSMAAARAAGKVDLSNPEMGAKVSLTVTDSALTQSHTEVPRGQVSFAVQNNSSAPRFVEVRGTIGAWKTMPLNKAGGFVILSMVLEPGIYEITSVGADSTAAGVKVLNGKITAN